MEPQTHIQYEPLSPWEVCNTIGARPSLLQRSQIQKMNNPPRDSFPLFTSGSTGTPKGIRLGQAGMMNYAASKRAHLGLGQVRVLQQTSSEFDMAIAQALNAFANGGTLVAAPLTARGDPTMILDIVRKHSIELAIATPSKYQRLGAYAADVLRDCHSWAHACSGGEAVAPRLLNVILDVLRRLELPNLVFTKCYGPTQISCTTTFQSTLLRPATAFKAALSVGKAIPNTALHIVADDGATTLPVEIPGEICVTGRGVARGYLGTSMNHQKTVEVESRQEKQSGLELMYRTSDRGYLQLDGTLVFTGHTDGGARRRSSSGDCVLTLTRWPKLSCKQCQLKLSTMSSSQCEEILSISLHMMSFLPEHSSVRGDSKPYYSPSNYRAT